MINSDQNTGGMFYSDNHNNPKNYKQTMYWALPTWSVTITPTTTPDTPTVDFKSLYCSSSRGKKSIKKPTQSTQKQQMIA